MSAPNTSTRRDNLTPRVLRGRKKAPAPGSVANRSEATRRRHAPTLEHVRHLSAQTTPAACHRALFLAPRSRQTSQLAIAPIPQRDRHIGPQHFAGSQFLNRSRRQQQREISAASVSQPQLVHAFARGMVTKARGRIFGDVRARARRAHTMPRFLSSTRTRARLGTPDRIRHCEAGRDLRELRAHARDFTPSTPGTH